MSKNVYVGDSLLQSKHADAAFRGDDGWALFWLDSPCKGKCTCVEYLPGNYPAVCVIIKANWKARRQIAAYRRDSERWKEGMF